MPIRRAPATPTQDKSPAAAADKDPEASSEESPSADEEQAVPSAAPADGEAAEETPPTENGEEAADDGAGVAASDEKEGEGGEGENGTDKKDCQTDVPVHETAVTEESTSDKCKDCAAGQCATHCYVLLPRMKDGYKYEKSKVKKVKRTIPAWASVAASKKIPVTNYSGTINRVDNILIEAITSCSNRSGVSYQFVMKYILKKYPLMDEKKFLIKKAMKRHLEKGTIKQLKGKGLMGKFTIGKQNAANKKGVQNKEKLGDALPLIITRLCEPKEASYILIKKYLEQHFPGLKTENRPDILKSALVKAVEKGQLERITGKGANGTFQLKRNKTQLKGTPVEDAITTAITAMNEPKTCSTTTLRKHLLETNQDGKGFLRVANLRRTLTRCKALGWMEQITGHGFSGTYQLLFPYYPSPTILYPEKYKDLEKKGEATPTRRRKRQSTSDDESEEESEEEEEEEEDEESDDEAIPQKRSTKRRPPPKARGPPPQKRSRSTGKGKGGRQVAKSPAKKSPAKKAAPSAKKSGKKPTPKRGRPSKATPVKKRGPAPKAKTMSKRGSKQPVYEEPSSDEASEDEAPVKKTARGGSKRSKADDSGSDEPAPKKAATKGGARRSGAKASKPATKRGAKHGKAAGAAGRKAKRGRK